MPASEPSHEKGTMYLLFYFVLEQADFSFKMFGVAIAQKSEFLFSVLSHVPSNSTHCPAGGLVLCLFESPFILSLLERSAEDLLQGKHRKFCSLPGRAIEFL